MKMWLLYEEGAAVQLFISESEQRERCREWGRAGTGIAAFLRHVLHTLTLSTAGALHIPRAEGQGGLRGQSWDHTSEKFNPDLLTW